LVPFANCGRKVSRLAPQWSRNESVSSSSDWGNQNSFTGVVMKIVVMIMFLCCCLGSSSAWAIDCLSAPGDPKSGWYSWRQIDGRKCWFLKTGAMPAKSQLHWPTSVREQAQLPEPASPSKPASSTERAAPVVVPVVPSDSTTRPEPKPPTVLQVKTIRVKPATAPLVRPGNGVDLMHGGTVSSMQPFDGARQNSTGAAPADTFNARFGPAR